MRSKLLSAFYALCSVVVAVNAKDLYVSTTSQLQAAIAAKNTSIVLNSGTYVIPSTSGFQVATAGTSIRAASNGKAIISCANQANSVGARINAANVKFQGIVFQYCATAVSVAATGASFNYVTVRNNTNLEAGSGIDLSYVPVNGAVTISNSVFQYNTAHRGGGISVAPGYATAIQISVSYSTFSYNTSPEKLDSTGYDNGGAAIGLFGAGNYLYVDTCSFVSNIAVGDTYGCGGAISLDDQVSARIDSSTFTNNRATNAGALCASDIGSVYIFDTTFSYNNAKNYDGAIGITRGNITVDSSTIIYNTAQGSAGIYFAPFTGNYALNIINSNVSLNDFEDVRCNHGPCTIVNTCNNGYVQTSSPYVCQATKASPFLVSSGAQLQQALADQYPQIVLGRGTFVAPSGGYKITVAGTKIYAKKAGTAFINCNAQNVNGFSITAANVVFDGLDIQKCGTAIYVNAPNSVTTLSNVILASNTNKIQQGAGVHVIDKSTVNIVNAYIGYNSGYAAIYNYGTVNLNSSTIQHNDGTGITANYMSVTNAANTVIGSNPGGGIAASRASAINLYGCSITYNFNRATGGGIMSDKSNLNIVNTQITHNSVTNSGGGIWATSGTGAERNTVSITGSRVTYNQCSSNSKLADTFFDANINLIVKNSAISNLQNSFAFCCSSKVNNNPNNQQCSFPSCN